MYTSTPADVPDPPFRFFEGLAPRLPLQGGGLGGGAWGQSYIWYLQITSFLAASSVVRLFVTVGLRGILRSSMVFADVSV